MTTENAACTPAPCDPCDSLGHHEQEFYAKRRQREATITTLGSLIDTQVIATYEDSIRNLKSVMDRHASWIAQYYALDTLSTSIQTDSVLAWLRRSEAYSGDLELLNHYFFVGDLTEFDALWSDVPTKYDLSGDNLGEFDELGLVYDIVRPVVENEGDFSGLSEIILDSLSFWQTWCSEPGFLSKSILRWNGIETEQDCDSPQKTTERTSFEPKKKVQEQANISTFKVYPNPADQTINIEFLAEYNNVVVSFFDIQGKLFKYEQMKMNEGVSSLFVGELPSGLYFLKFRSDTLNPVFSKLEIFH